jgi:hypothetical protein
MQMVVVSGERRAVRAGRSQLVCAHLATAFDPREQGHPATASKTEAMNARPRMDRAGLRNSPRPLHGLDRTVRDEVYFDRPASVSGHDER